MSAASLDAARYVAQRGVPLFLARPAGRGAWDPVGGTGGCGYWLPAGWERTEPDPTVVDRWQPGMALAAVMGHAVDGLDVDPRNGGLDSLAGITVPRVYGVQETPSRGWHGLIAPLGTGSRDAVRPGIDVKGGRADGTGRGFLWIAPTVRLSKSTGEIAAYTWSRTPDLAGIGEDETGVPLADAIRALREPAPRRALTTLAPAFSGHGTRLLAGLVAVVLSAPEGERNKTLFWAACRANEHGRAGRLDRTAAERALEAAGRRIGLGENEIRASIKSATTTGASA